MRTLTARLKGEQPGPEASIRKLLGDEHGQHVMELARDLIGPAAMLTGGDGTAPAKGAQFDESSFVRAPRAATSAPTARRGRSTTRAGTTATCSRRP